MENHMKEKENWGMMLAVLRAAAGMSQEDLARRIHRSRPYVSRRELEVSIPTDDVLLDWIHGIGGLRTIDWLLRHLQALRARAVFAMDFPQLLQV